MKVMIPRFMNDSFLQTLCGCDFLTPFDHSVKPKCKFCGTENVDWSHILFVCTKRDNGFKIVQTFLTKCDTLLSSKVDPETKERIRTLSDELRNLWKSKDFSKLFYLMMAVNLHEFNLEYIPLVNLLVSTMAPIIYSVQRDWE